MTLMDMESVIEKNFIPVFPSMDLGTIVQQAIIKSNRNIYPVVNEKTQALVGIILLDDLRPIMFDQSLYNEVLAQDIMQDPPQLIFLGKDKMADVMKKFQDSGAWNLPVIKDGMYYGFISKSKMLTVYRRKLITFTN